MKLYIDTKCFSDRRILKLHALMRHDTVGETVGFMLEAWTFFIKNERYSLHLSTLNFLHKKISKELSESDSESRTNNPRGLMEKSHNPHGLLDKKPMWVNLKKTTWVNLENIKKQSQQADFIDDYLSGCLDDCENLLFLNNPLGLLWTKFIPQIISSGLAKIKNDQYGDEIITLVGVRNRINLLKLRRKNGSYGKNGGRPKIKKGEDNDDSLTACDKMPHPPNLTFSPKKFNTQFLSSKGGKGGVAKCKTERLQIVQTGKAQDNEELVNAKRKEVELAIRRAKAVNAKPKKKDSVFIVGTVADRAKVLNDCTRTDNPEIKIKEGDTLLSELPKKAEKAGKKAGKKAAKKGKKEQEKITVKNGLGSSTSLHNLSKKHSDSTAVLPISKLMQVELDSQFIADYLVSAISGHSPRFAVTSSKRAGWIKCISRAMRIDKRSRADLMRIIDYTHKSEELFWRSNILSAAKLRKHAEMILIKLKSIDYISNDVRVGQAKAKSTESYSKVGKVKL